MEQASGTSAKPASDERQTSQGAKLGIWACSALVVGNVIGSGFYLSPSALAPYGLVAVVGWVLMTIGAICLGLVFARLASIAPATGGPYAFAKQAFGPLAGFLIAWGYWISMWTSQPAIALAFAGYMSIFFPDLKESPMATTFIALGAMWLVVFINARGTKEAGVFQTLTVALKLVPFLAIASLGLFWIKPENFGEFNPSGMPFPAALMATAPILMFAFLGVESATVPAGHVHDPKRTIPRATIIGVILCGFVFIAGTVVVMGTVPREILANSHAPFADAAGMMWGKWASIVVAVAVVLSSIAALNGWTLLMGQVTYAAAKDGVFPRLFEKTNRRDVPVPGIIVSICFSSALLLLQCSGVDSLIEAYDFVIQLATTTEMIPYAVCALAEGALFVALVSKEKGFRIGPFQPVALVAFVFAVLTIWGSGAEADMWGLILLLLGLPFYVALKRDK